MKSDQELLNKVIASLPNLDEVGVARSIILYKLLRELYYRNTDILGNELFKWAYSAYYGLSSHYKKTEINQYFIVLQKYVSCKSPLSVDKIVAELNTQKKQYVFATKLMNFVDDEKYPIVDRKIAILFGFSVNDIFSSKYDTVLRVYELLLKRKELCIILNEYDFTGIGKMKQVDIILWNINHN